MNATRNYIKQIMALLKDAERETREAAARIDYPAAGAGAE